MRKQPSSKQGVLKRIWNYFSKMKVKSALRRQRKQNDSIILEKQTFEDTSDNSYSLNVFTSEALQWIQELTLDTHSEQTLTQHQRDTLKKFVAEVLWMIIEPKLTNINFAIRSMAKELVGRFVSDVVHIFSCDPRCYFVGLAYLERFLNDATYIQYLTLTTYKIYFFLAVVLAQKMWEDRYYDNRVYYKLFNKFNFMYTAAQFNGAEREMLLVMNYELYFPTIKFKQFIQRMHYKVVCACERRAKSEALWLSNIV